MLYADKQALETDLKVSLLSIRERELNLYATNCRSIGTQAALLAGFAYGGCCLASYFFPDESSGISRAVYLVVTTCAMDLNVAALLASTVCAMLGPGLALRGPDGSMEQAVEGLALEFRFTFVIFFLGLSFFYVSAMLYVMIVLNHVLSALLTLLMAVFIWHTFVSLKRIYKKFRLPSHRAVAGHFAIDGSTGGTVLSDGQLSADAHRLTKLCELKRPWQWPQRQLLYLRVFLDDFVGISATVHEQRYRDTAAKSEVDLAAMTQFQHLAPRNQAQYHAPPSSREKNPRLQQLCRGLRSHRSAYETSYAGFKYARDYL